MPKEHKTAPAGVAMENKRMFLFGLGGLLLLAVVIILSITLYRVYYKTSEDKFTGVVATILRLPAVKVEGQTITYKDYLNDMNAIRQVKNYDSQNNGALSSATEEQLRNQVLWRLVTNALVDKLAKENGVVVKQEEIDTIKTQVLSQFGGDETKLNAELQKRYGWNLQTYQDRVIKPYVLEQDLAEKIAANEEYKKDAQTQAQKVLDQIKGGSDFAEMAKQYGTDGTAKNGGDLGWFSKGEMVPEFETAVFALKVGELDPNLVETQFGYHIVQTLEIRTGTSTDADGKVITGPQAHARHILFRFKSLDTMLNDLITGNRVKLFLQVKNPFKLDTTSTATESK